MELKKITPEQAFTALREGKKVYAIREVDLSITLTDLLTENLAVEVEESVAPNKPESGGGSRKKLDWGKIAALHNAGWTNAAIAEEMNASESTIVTGLSKLRRKADGKKQGTEADLEAEEANS